MWAKVTPLTFSKVSSGPADIEIVFEKRKDDDYSFDGRGGELAYAYFPGNNKGELIKWFLPLSYFSKIKSERSLIEYLRWVTKEVCGLSDRVRNRIGNFSFFFLTFFLDCQKYWNEP